MQAPVCLPEACGSLTEAQKFPLPVLALFTAGLTCDVAGSLCLAQISCKAYGSLLFTAQGHTLAECRHCNPTEVGAELTIPA